MPIYAYECKSCGVKFEAFRSIHDRDEDVTCPECLTPHPRRVISNVFSRASTGSGSSGYRAPT